MMCGYFYIGFTDFILKGKNLANFINLFLPHDFEKNDPGLCFEIKYKHE